VKAVACGGVHTCVILDNGRLKCWGSGGINTVAVGTLGLGDTLNRGDQPGEMGASLPYVNLGAGRVAVSVVAGAFHTCVLLDNAQVKCWGWNQYGQLGLGDAVDRGGTPDTTPDQLPAVDLGTANGAVTALSAAGAQTCALFENGRIKCWGDNTWGQLGLGDALNRGDQPGQMGDSLPVIELGSNAGGSPLKAVAVAAANGRTCALFDSGQIKCWGSGWQGQLGLGDTANRGDGPNEMGDNLPFVDLGAGRSGVAIAAGDIHNCALLDNLAVKCWGESTYGELGLGDTSARGDDPGEMGDNLPTLDLGTAASVARLVADDAHTCALLTDSHVKCWGINQNGTLGLGDALDRGNQPGQMGDNLPAVDLGTTPAPVDLSAGFHHTCVVFQDGTLKCWGKNGSGRLGLGDTLDRGDQPGEMGDALPFVQVD